MIHTIAAALLSTLLAQAPTDARQNRAPQTDQTVPAARGTRLVIENKAGEIVVRAWEKDAVRVQARHTSRAKINVRVDASAIRIDAVSDKGPTGSIDYDINAPAWMPVKIEGQYDYVSVEGIQGEISVETVRGDIVLKNVSSAIAKTIEGAIEVDGGRGKLTLSSVNEEIKVAGATGEVVADTTNGEITLTRMEAVAVEVATVNGDVVYEGRFADRGHYSFTNHSGDIELVEGPLGHGHRARPWQIEGHLVGGGGDGDDEHDQQHEHHVDQGRGVDLGDCAGFGGGAVSGHFCPPVRLRGLCLALLIIT